VDIVSSLQEIGPVLKNLISGIALPEESSEDEERALEHFLEELHRNHNVDFRSYKRPTILRRLRRRMAVLDCESIEEYSGYLEEHPEQYRQLIDTFLIKVTEFFRDPQLFDNLKEEVLPGLIEEAREEKNQLRVWSAGCATG
jgi:two-component system, chemotaxis family, CheB/CheR fusion protein